MWKHKNFINLQLCAGPIPYEVIVNGTTFSIQRLSDSGLTGENTWSYNASINTDTYSISGNTVVWNDGTILQYNGIDVLPTDDIIGIVGNPGIYTTRAATPALTFKHFYDAGTIGSGTVKFRHYSQQEPSTSETWVLNETLKGEPYGLYNEYATTIDFTSNGENFIKIGVDNDHSTNPWIRYYTNSTENLVYSYGKWSNTAYRTLTFATAPTGDLLTWLQANGTKQGGGGGASN